MLLRDGPTNRFIVSIRILTLLLHTIKEARPEDLKFKSKY